ncbi:TetR family transcriptional regulator [Caballeronia novacaledonica]|uniref:TetR family transcriptional regulator n=1 Tax=Caballeronia novacaledonica TaxID=1544861 RepID=A0A2U3IC33_9BURK|nr:TetR/AcrR family transcriptional regulator [Caballeronia novacaledonica]SPB17765.1 TetR family transcriptional regulator [Caballeronia novacaledonica]
MSPKISADVPYHHGNLREALIAEGRRALEDVGAHELSLRYLARAVGVSEAAPSRHFAGKEGLLAAIAADGWRDLAALRREILGADNTAMTAAYRMLRVYVEFAQSHKGLFDLMVGPRIVARDSYPELTEEGSISFRLFASSVEQAARENGWPESTLTLVTHAAWSIEHGLATLILSDRVPRSDLPVQIDHIIHFSIGMFLSAVAAGPAHLESMLDQLPAMNGNARAAASKT